MTVFMVTVGHPRSFRACSATSGLHPHQKDRGVAAHRRSGSPLVDEGETDAYRRGLSLRAITSKVNAILVYVSTLEGWHLLLGLAVAVSRTTKFYAVRLFRSLCRRYYRPSMQIDWAALPGANGSHR